MNRYALPIALLTATLALTAVAVAAGSRKVECAGNLCLADNGGISPSTLPRHEYAPITARLMGELSTRDGTHPPAVRRVQIDVDKTLAIDAVGLPTCRASQLQARSSTAAKRACGSAIVGTGSAEVEVAFPEQAPFSSRGPVLLFNSGIHGRTTSLLLHAYVNVPAPTAVVTKVTVTRIHRGPFGLRIVAQVPKIAGGAGSVTKFELKVGRRFTYKGRKRSFLTATCPTGHWVTKGNVRFDDGTEVGLTHLFPCTPRG